MHNPFRMLKRGSFSVISLVLVLTILMSTTAFAVSTFDLSPTAADNDIAATGEDTPARKRFIGKITNLNEESSGSFNYGFRSIVAGGTGRDASSVSALSSSLTGSFSDELTHSAGGTVTGYMDNSVDFRLMLRRNHAEVNETIKRDSIHIYQLLDGDVKGEEITSSFTVSYTDAIASSVNGAVDDTTDGYGYIDGLNTYTGDIYIEAQSYVRDSYTDIVFVNAEDSTNSGSITITTNKYGCIAPGTGTRYYYRSQTYSGSTENIRIASGANYTATYNGSDKNLRMAQLIYKAQDGSSVIRTYAAENNSLTFTLPESLPRETSSRAKVYFYFSDTTYTPAEPSDGTDYTVTVKAHYPDGFDNANYQTIEYYADTSSDTPTQSSKIADGGSYTFTIPTADYTPTFNVKDSRDTSANVVSVTAVKVTAGGADLTQEFFGGQKYYQYFLESTKTGVFGFFELQNVTGEITIDVTYGAPFTGTLADYSSNTMHVANFVVKGDASHESTVGNSYTDDPSAHGYTNRYLLYDGTGTYSDSFPDGNYIGRRSYSGYDSFLDGCQHAMYYPANNYDFYITPFSYISDVKVYNENGTELDISSFCTNNPVGQPRGGSNNSVKLDTDHTDFINARGTVVITYKKLDYNHIKGSVSFLNDKADVDSEAATCLTAKNSSNNSYNAFLNSAKTGMTAFISQAYTANSFEGYYADFDGADYDRIDIQYAGNNQYDRVLFKEIKIYALDENGEKTDTDVTARFNITYSNITNNSNNIATVTGLKDYHGGIYIDVKAYYSHTKTQINVITDSDNPRTGTVKLEGTGTPKGFFRQSNSDSANSITLNSSTDSTSDYYISSNGSYQITYSGNDKLSDGKTVRKLRLAVLTYQDENGDYVKVPFQAVDGVINMTTGEYYRYNNAATTSLDIYFNDTDTDPTAEQYEYRPFKWIIDTTVAGADTNKNAKPLTTITGRIASPVSSTYTVTNTNFDGVVNYQNEGDEKVTVTLGGDNSPVSAFYNTNLVYNLTNPSDNSVYAKFRVYHDDIIPVDCDQTTLDQYVSNKTVSTVENTYGVCEGLTFDLTVPQSGMQVTFTPMYTYIPVEIVQQILDDDGNVIGQATDAFTSEITQYKYSTSYETDYSANKYFYVNDTTDYYSQLTASDGFVNAYNAAGASTKSWMAKGYYYYGLNVKPRGANGYYYDSLYYEVKSRTNETIRTKETMTNQTFVSGFGHHDNMRGNNISETGTTWMEYGSTDSWNSNYIAADKIVIYVNYKKDAEDFVNFKWTRDRSSYGAGDYWPMTQLTAKFQEDNQSSDTFKTKNVTRTYLDNHPDTIDVQIKNDKKSDSSATNPVTVDIGSNSLYYVNLVFTMKSYDESIEYGKFRLFKDQLITISGNPANYISVSPTYTHFGSVNETISFTLNIPNAGMAVDYAVMESYIPLTVTQSAVDESDNALPLSDSMTVQVYDYLCPVWYDNNTTGGDGFPQSTVDNRNDMIANKCFTANDMSGDYYSVVTDSSAQGCVDHNGYTVSGASDSRWMLMPINVDTNIKVKPNVPAGYMLKSVELIARDKDGNTLNASTVDASLTKNDAGYYLAKSSRVYYNQGAAWEINVTYVKLSDIYAPFKWTIDPTYKNGDWDPYQSLNGTFLYDDGYSANPNQTIVSLEKNDFDGILKGVNDTYSATVTVGGLSGNSIKNTFYNQNLVYTLTSYDGTENYAKFRIFKGQIIPVDCTQDTLNTYVSAFTQNNTDSYGAFQTASFTLTLPAVDKNKGIAVTFSALPVYVPIKINQYVLDENGTTTSVSDNEFTARVVPRYNTSADERSIQRTYTLDSTSDYYSIINRSISDNVYTHTYDVTSASDSRLMYIYKGYSSQNGVNVTLTPKSGYMFDHISYTAKSSADNSIPLTDNGLFKLGEGYSDDNYFEVYTSDWRDLAKAADWEINIYYAPETVLTVHQLSPLTAQGNFGNVYIDDADSQTGKYLAPAYHGLNYAYKDNVTITTGASGAPVTLDSGDYKETTDTVRVKLGAKPRVKITPIGSRKIESVHFYSDAERENEITYTLNSETSTYTLSDYSVKYGDQIYLDIVYAAQQHLDVKVYMMEPGTGSTSTLNTDSNITVTVTGVPQDDSYAFTLNSEGVNNFSTHSEQSVEVSPKTALKIATEIPSNNAVYSEYIVADVKLREGTPLSDASSKVSPETKTIHDAGGNDFVGRNYANCTIANLTTGRDGEISVYIAKMKKVNVSVYTADTSGHYGDQNGEPNGVPSETGSYVSVHSANPVNNFAFVTMASEGNYTTNEFTITSDPAKRTVSAIQGTTVSVYAQLPDSGNYVVSRVLSSGGFTSATVSRVSYVTDPSDNTKRFMRVDINTNAKIDSTFASDYDIKIYITPAQSIKITSDYKETDGSILSQNYGTVRVDGNPAQTGDIPFTVISPNIENSSTYYTTSNGHSAIYSEAKCVAGTTGLTFTITPQSNYRVSEVAFSQAGHQLTDYTVEDGDGDVKIYHFNRPMSALYDLDVHITYEIKNSATVYFRIQYTDDGSTWHQGIELGDIWLSSYNLAIERNGKDVKLINDLTDPVQPTSYKSKTFEREDTSTHGGFVDSYSHLTESPLTHEDGYYKIEVIAGSDFGCGIQNYKDGKMYVPIVNMAKISDGSTTGYRYYSDQTYANWEKLYISGNETYTYDVKLVPASTITFIDQKNNHYGDEPENVDAETHNYSITTLHGENRGTDPNVTSNMVFGRSTNSWRDYESGSNTVAYGSVFTNFTMDQEHIQPGKVVKLQLYEFPKGYAVNGLNTIFNPQYCKVTVELNGGTASSYDFSDYTMQPDKQYVVYTEVDNIDVFVYSHGNPGNVYLVYTDTATDKFRIGDAGVQATPVTSYGYTRLDESYKTKKGPAYLVVVTDQPKEKVYPYETYFRDYNQAADEHTRQDIQSKFSDSYRAVTNADGSVQYYWYYQINPSDTRSNSSNDNYPVDNSVYFDIWWRWVSDPTPVTPDPEKPATVIVSQYERIDYNKYEPSQEATAVLYNSTQNKDVATITGAEGFFTCNVNDYINFTLTPKDGFVPEKYEYIVGGSTTSSGTIGNSFNQRISSNEVQIKIYYYRPAIRITTTNEASAPKAEITVENLSSVVTDGSNVTTLIQKTDYSKSMMVDHSSRQLITVKPQTYESIVDGSTVIKNYEVKSILLGNDRTTMLPIYSDGEILNNAYTISVTDDGDTTLLLKEDQVRNDLYLFVQLIGDVEVKTAQLVVEQYIQSADEKDENGDPLIVPCDTVKVDVSATNNDSETPLLHQGTNVSAFTMNPIGVTDENRAYTDEATLVKGSRLYVVPDSTTFPEDYKVGSYTITYGENQEQLLYNASTYEIAFGASGSPDSGVILVKIVYVPDVTDFTLRYHYKGRADTSDENGGYYDGETGAVDKTYTTTVSLKGSQLDENNQPAIGVLMDNAAAVSDLYKDCKWVFDGDEKHVAYNKDGAENTVDITADQPYHQYSVEFVYFNDQGELTTQRVEQVPLNSLVKPEGSFVTAPAKHGENDFTYWEVTSKDTGNEIARCYCAAFNLRVTGDIVVTAKYEAAVNLVSISDPVFTREQTTDESGKTSDTLYADFILAYMEQNGLLLSEKTSDEYKTGLIIEQNRTALLNKEDVTGATVSDEEMNAAKALYGADSVLKADDAKTMLLSGNASTTSGDTRYLYYAVNNVSYNNKNRVDKSLSVPNVPIYRKLVMRAYYYVYNVGTQTMELSAPVYFCFYDIGNSKSDISSAATGSAPATPDEVPAKEDQ